LAYKLPFDPQALLNMKLLIIN